MVLVVNMTPVMGVDPSGYFLIPFMLVALAATVGGIAGVFVGSYLGFTIASTYDPKVKADMDRINWNPFNSDELTVLNANKVSFYKGQPVLRCDCYNNRSFSLFFMFLDENEPTNLYGVNTVKHEWGHFIQMGILGLPKYLIFIGLPSMLNLSTGDYYSKPWERSADIFGGVDPNYRYNVYDAYSYEVSLWYLFWISIGF